MLRGPVSEFDPIERFSGVSHLRLTQLLVGVFCFAAAWLVREFIDLFARGAGPFSLMFPAIMIATLYGRWPAGLVTCLLAFAHAWYFVLPYEHSFDFERPEDLARTIVNGINALIILYFAEAFRAGMRRASSERDAELKAQRLLMKELEHRTKNNFAMVAGLLSIQERSNASLEVKEALSTAAARVRSFAAIHETIYTAEKYSAEISLPHYLGLLLRELDRALFRDRPVEIVLKCDPIWAPRDRAVAFGLIVNELVTNAAKHAFPDGRSGQVTVEYQAEPGAPWRLTICDDGCGPLNGAAVDGSAVSGLGNRLMESFARTAGARIVIEARDTGHCVSLVEEAESPTTPLVR